MLKYSGVSPTNEHSEMIEDQSGAAKDPVQVI